MPKIIVTQIRNGKRVTFLTKDKGEPGKTPKEDRWYEPGVHTGWSKGMARTERRRKVLSAHNGNTLSSARAMQSLANVTTDAPTRREAMADAKYFYTVHNRRRKDMMPRRGTMRITPRMPRLR